MFNRFGKSCLLGLLTLCAMNSPLAAWDDCCNACPSDRFYIGAFGGGLYSSSAKATQMGTAFFLEAEGGPLAVHAEGNLKKNSTGFGGVQLGYEWASLPGGGFSNWNIGFAAEAEAFFFSHKRSGHLINPTLRLPEHDFDNSFKMNMDVILVNGIFSLNDAALFGFTPYVGGGLGAARIGINHATSTQVSPPEVGINHFNSKRNDSTWAFAGQVKAGLRYNICESFHIFAEYRYLYLDSTNYIFGSTNYPTHAPTSPWNVNVKNMQYNAWVLGLQYDL